MWIILAEYGLFSHQWHRRTWFNVCARMCWASGPLFRSAVKAPWTSSGLWLTSRSLPVSPTTQLFSPSTDYFWSVFIHLPVISRWIFLVEILGKNVRKTFKILNKTYKWRTRRKLKTLNARRTFPSQICSLFGFEPGFFFGCWDNALPVRKNVLNLCDIFGRCFCLSRQTSLLPTKTWTFLASKHFCSLSTGWPRIRQDSSTTMPTGSRSSV